MNLDPISYPLSRAYTLHCFMMRFFHSPLTNFPLMEYQSENLFGALGILAYGVRFYHKNIIEQCVVCSFMFIKKTNL